MDRLGDVTAKRALLLLGAFIVLGGFALALLSNSMLSGTFGSAGFGPTSANDKAVGLNNSYLQNGVSYVAAVPGSSNQPQGSTQVVVTTVASTTTNFVDHSNQPQGNGTGGATAGTGSLVEISSNLNIRSSTPATAA